MPMRHAVLAIAIACASLAIAPARAADAKIKSDGTFGAAPVVADGELAAQRAKGEDGSILCSLCTADGTSTISGNAFQNAVGVFTVVQNTGNQVFMNTVTVVNVSISK